MYFKRLEIFGFKSFADKTVMNFEPGITVIVGPNGCGKSNVFDSIRWVLGEQSVKELRGASMEDVIFNGTDKKPGLGFAEVSLTFSNESRMLSIDYNEVTVTRRLFRSGESEYLLNKTPVRLKDITELFMGTGIGAEAYSLVQQGKVDLVVSARPEDRRVILDEASGITKYKAKRREATNKLKDTESNLLRINDIVTEVKRQISSLERQASKARRYKEEFEKLKGYEVRFARYEIDQLGRQKRSLKGQGEEARQKERSLAEEVEEFNELAGHEAQQIEDYDEKINEVNAGRIKLDGQIDLHAKQIGFNEERISSIAQTIQRSEEKRQDLQGRISGQNAKIRDVQAQLAELAQSMEGGVVHLRNRKEALEEISQSVEAAQQAIHSDEQKILDLTAHQVKMKNRLTEVMKDVQGSLARQRRLEMEWQKVKNEKEQVDLKYNGICQNLDSTGQKVRRLEESIAGQEQVIQGMHAQLKAMGETISELEKKKLFLISQKEFIEKLSTQYEGIPDPVVGGKLFTQTRPEAHHSGIIGKVKEVLSLQGEDIPPALQALRGQDGTVYEIVCEAKFIELDPQHISRRIEDLSRVIEEKHSQQKEVAARKDEQQDELSRLMLEIQEEGKVLSVFQSQKEDVTGEQNKLTEELELVRMELEEVTGALTNSRQQEEDLSKQLDSLAQQLNASQAAIKEQQALIAGKTREREQTAIEIAHLETEVASYEDKKAGLEGNIKMIQETVDSWMSEIGQLDEEARQMQSSRIRFDDEIAEWNEKIEDLRQEQSSLNAVCSNYEREKSEVVQRLQSLRANITSCNKEIEQLRNHAHVHEMKEQELAFKEKEIKDRLLQAYRIDFDLILPESGGKDAEGAPEEASPQKDDFSNPEDLRREIERLRKRCDAFGSVNLVAIEEFDQLRERFEFLTKQQSDLLSAKASLHQTILKINRQTRQMFMETFTKVSEEFRIYYRMLFGGGDAQLLLNDTENVLESGIDIIARPPGKKLQNISLLSGGEKTLTAIALIFGVFKVNPSPFCVLDEIDAALDESNVGRFSYLLKDFSKIAQFIVITHNKKTISSGDVMYGVTMQETGVSKVVSVKFAEDYQGTSGLTTQEAQLPANV